MKPELGSRWVRGGAWDESLGEYNAYTVYYITNTGNPHKNHPPQVIYMGDNGKVWSLPLDKWPGNLNPVKVQPKHNDNLSKTLVPAAVLVGMIIGGLVTQLVHILGGN